MPSNHPYPDSSVPGEIRERRQWVLWGYQKRSTGKPTKVPFQIDGEKASTTEPSNWNDYYRILAALSGAHGKYDGLGFVFCNQDPYTGIDLDDCLDDRGQPKAWAQPILDQFGDTYSEISPSGRGVKIWSRAKLPGTGRKAYVDANGNPVGRGDPRRDGAVELYDRGRFFTVTGQNLSDAPLQITDRQADVCTLYQRFGSSTVPAQGDLHNGKIIAVGNRHDYLVSVAGKFAAKGSDVHAVIAAVEAINRNECEPPKPPDEVRKICEWAVKQEGQKGRRIGEAPTGDTLPSDQVNLPVVFTNNHQLRDVTRTSLAALQSANDPPFLFVRSGQMVAVTIDEKKRQVISEVSEAALRGRLTRSADYFRTNAKGNPVDCTPPIEVVRDILALPRAEWCFQPLDGVVEAPILRPDGSVLEKPGYDPDTRLYYAPDPSLRVPLIAEQPMRDHIEVALDLIGQVIGEFPFVDQASKANAIAAMLTPIVRPAIDAPAPMALFDAPEAGTGKSLLADVISIIATGRPGEMFSAPRDDDEWRKQITTALKTGASVVVIDNVTRRLDNGDLCRVLTATLYADREFRTHQKLSLPVKSTWIATGNNIQPGGDMPRRCYWVRLDAKTSRPFLRTGFQIGDLKAWVTEHRGAVLAALLSLARAWYAAGSPKAALQPLGSYEVWSVTLGGILAYAGVEGFLENSGELYQGADAESVQWEAFFQQLHEIFGAEPFLVAQIVEKLGQKVWNDISHVSESREEAAKLRSALPDTLAEAVDRDGFFQRRAGKSFAAIVGKRFGESQIYIKRDTLVHNAQRWQIIIPAEDGGS